MGLNVAHQAPPLTASRSPQPHRERREKGGAVPCLHFPPAIAHQRAANDGLFSLNILLFILPGLSCRGKTLRATPTELYAGFCVKKKLANRRKSFIKTKVPINRRLRIPRDLAPTSANADGACFCHHSDSLLSKDLLRCECFSILRQKYKLCVRYECMKFSQGGTF